MKYKDNDYIITGSMAFVFWEKDKFNFFYLQYTVWYHFDPRTIIDATHTM